MAFRFKPAETFEQGFRRIALEQIDRALKVLRGSGEQSVAVHEARKSLKRLRALLRLVRPAIGEKAFKAENAFLRDIACGLSGARDRYVLAATLQKLTADAELSQSAFIDDVHRYIAGMAATGAPEHDTVAIAQADSRLEEARMRLLSLAVAGDGFDVVGAGLEQLYRRARQAFVEAYRRSDDEAFHEWRKGTQTHWRQMLLLEPAWSEYCGARANEAQTLSQLLGDDHDLALLVGVLQADAPAAAGEDRARIMAAAAAAQKTLRAEARARGQRLFAVGPKRLRRCMGEFWRAAETLRALQGGGESATASSAPAAKSRQRVGKVRRKPGEVTPS